MFGVWGRILDVDLDTNTSRILDVPEEVFRKFVGGRGLAAWLLWDELGDRWESVDPLGPENLLLVLTGPLTGYYPGAKLVVSGKSPQSNGVVGSTVSSELAVDIKTAGYDGLIIRGASETPVYIYVDSHGAQIRDASPLWGLGGLKLIAALNHLLESDLNAGRGLDVVPSYIYIGPAGENLVRTSVVMSKLTHAAGYGGYGALMGSKKVKAVVAKGSGPMPPVHDSEGFARAWREALGELCDRMRTFRYWGTTQGLWTTGYRTSSEPIKNWMEEWHNIRAFTHEVLERKCWVRNLWSDWGCPTSCMKVSKVLDNGTTYVTDGPDYEMGAYLGSNLGVFDMPSVVKLSALADELGLCGIQTGNVLGFAIELFERGYLSRVDVGCELRWGNVECVRKFMEDIAYRRGLGGLMAEGTYRAALKLSTSKGVDLLKYAVQVKGIAVGAHGVRSGLDYPQKIAYAGSVQGGDHTSTAGTPVKSTESEAFSAFLDSAVVCIFNTMEVEKLVTYMNVVTGWGLTEDDLYASGVRILTLQRVLLLLGGPDVFWDPRVHDDNPERFYEPLPGGPKAGGAPRREDVRIELGRYYSELGWDELGIPKEETLERLGLVELAREIGRVKARLGINA
ncbi:MAG: aldehyde ferredoxin oxidoreductase C-terminal domain-containing protein [Zestosphaera sp.]